MEISDSTPITTSPQTGNIILVDDERTNLKALELMLGSLGHNIISLTSGHEAIAFIEQNATETALLILDIHMPDMDGFEIAQRIQQLNIQNYIPVIFLTGSATGQSFMYQGYEQGAFDYLSRDVPPQILRSKVKAFLKLYEQSKKIQEQTEQLQQTLSVVEEKEKELRDFFDRANDLIHGINAEGEFIYVNQRWLETLGYSRTELNHLHFLDIVHPSHHERYETVFAALQQGIPQQEVELLFLHKNGDLICLEGNISCYFNEGEFISTRAIFRDITKRKEAESHMQAALDKEKQVSELQSRFVATASHEFRTPLTGILSATELLQAYWDKFSHEEHLDYLGQIYDSALLMRNLMNDVLLVSKAEAGRMQFNPSPCNVAELADELLRQINERIRKNHQTELLIEGFSTEIDHNLDRKLLQLVLTNLVSNAMKYSPEQSKITVKIESLDSRLNFNIQDEGEGIALVDQPHVFDSFRRGKNTHDVPGTGLGLNIVKHCVELHHGTIDFTSEPGVGTCFSFSLPTDISES